MKPHKGYLENWYESIFPNGTIIWGLFDGHNLFNGRYGHTSMIIARDGNEIETLNPRYTLGKPLKDTQCSGDHSVTASSAATLQPSTP